MKANLSWSATEENIKQILSLKSSKLKRIKWPSGAQGEKKGTLYGNGYVDDMQICRWHCLNGIKQRVIKQPIDKGEKGAWKRLA